MHYHVGNLSTMGDRREADILRAVLVNGARPGWPPVPQVRECDCAAGIVALDIIARERGERIG